MIFPEIPANKRSIASRKPVYGVGVNDAPYVVNPTIDGKKTRCPFYSTWHHMLARCYSANSLQNKPTYQGCSVSTEWLTFSKFRIWMEAQNWKGKTIDKDILSPGNKVYSPGTCVFVSQSLNKLLNINQFRISGLPVGVYRTSAGNYRAEMRASGKYIHLGCYPTTARASAAYRQAKRMRIAAIASQQSDPRIADGLLRHAGTLA